MRFRGSSADAHPWLLEISCRSSITSLNVLILGIFNFLFLNKMLVFRAGMHKMLVRMTYREDPDQTASNKQSNLGLRCLSRPFWQLTSVLNSNIYQTWQTWLNSPQKPRSGPEVKKNHAQLNWAWNSIHKLLIGMHFEHFFCSIKTTCKSFTQEGKKQIFSF